MHDHILSVDQHPVASRQAFDPRPTETGLFEAPDDFIRHRADMALRAAGGDYHGIGDIGFSGKRNRHDVLGLVGVKFAKNNVENFAGTIFAGQRLEPLQASAVKTSAVKICFRMPARERGVFTGFGDKFQRGFTVRRGTMLKGQRLPPFRRGDCPRSPNANAVPKSGQVLPCSQVWPKEHGGHRSRGVPSLYIGRWLLLCKTAEG